MNHTRIDRISLKWYDHKATLWWLGLLYRCPNKFRQIFQNLSKPYKGYVVGLWLYCHSLPYVVLISIVGQIMLFDRLGISPKYVWPIGDWIRADVHGRLIVSICSGIWGWSLGGVIAFIIVFLIAGWNTFIITLVKAGYIAFFIFRGIDLKQANSIASRIYRRRIKSLNVKTLNIGFENAWRETKRIFSVFSKSAFKNKGSLVKWITVIIPLMITLVIMLIMVSVGGAVWSSLGIALGIALWFSFGFVDKIAFGLAFAIAFGIASGLALGKDVILGIAFGIAFGNAFGIVFGNAFGIAFGISGGMVSGILGGSTFVAMDYPTGGIAFCVAFISFLFRLYYYPFHILFIWPRVRGFLYRVHPIVWDDLCAFPFPWIDRLLIAYAEQSLTEGEAEIERLINFYPSQRTASLRAKIVLLARKMSKTANLAELDQIGLQLPDGEKKFLIQTRHIRDVVNEIAQMQIRFNVANLHTLRNLS